MRKRQFLVRALSLMISCGCNLKCEYCRISQAVNAGSADLQHNTIKALQDGTYLKNVEAVLEKCNQSPMAIEHIALWGQEPTLTLHYFADHLEDWFKVFPNWKGTMFSTNTVDHMDRILYFIDQIEKYAPSRFNLDIQFSYDGEYSTSKLRGAEPSKIHDNLVYLFTELNKKPLKKVSIQVNHHSVLSMHLLENLMNTKNIFEYSLAQKEWGAEFQDLIQNKNVHQNTRGCDSALENPVEASVDEGTKLWYFGQLAERFNMMEYYPEMFSGDVPFENNPCTLAESILTGGFVVLREIFDYCNERNIMPRDLFDVAGSDPILMKEMFKRMNFAIFCGNGTGEMKIMWDGTLCNCQNHIYDMDVKYLPYDTNKFEDCVKHSLATHKYFVNPLKDSDEDIDKWFALFEACKTSCLEFTFRSVVTMMQFMVELGQIDESYRDMRKLVNHAFYVALMNCCSYNNQIMTGSIFTRPTGFIRLFCNGHLDNMIHKFNKQMGAEVF